jgi:hypothetical protein
MELVLTWEEIRKRAENINFWKLKREEHATGYDSRKHLNSNSGDCGVGDDRSSHAPKLDRGLS